MANDFDDLEDPTAAARMEAAYEEYYQRLADDEEQARNDDDERRKREAEEQDDMRATCDRESDEWTPSERTPRRRDAPEEWKADPKPNTTHGQPWKMALIGVGSMIAGVAGTLLFDKLFRRRS